MHIECILFDYSSLNWNKWLKDKTAHHDGNRMKGASGGRGMTLSEYKIIIIDCSVSQPMGAWMYIYSLPSLNFLVPLNSVLCVTH